jgi:hypothetical protein
MYRRVGNVVCLLVALCSLSCRAPKDDVDGLTTTAPFKRQALDVEWIQVQTGPWGSLEYRRFFLPIPKDWLEGQPRSEPCAWQISGISPARVNEFMTDGTLSVEEQRLWRDTCRVEPNGDGTIIHPSKEFRWALQPRSRAMLYLWLAQFPENVAQNFPFCYATVAAKDWIPDNTLPPDLAASIQRLSYQSDLSVCFADLDLIEDQIPDLQQRAELLGLLYRHPYCEVRLRIDQHSDLVTLANYWGGMQTAGQVKAKLKKTLGKKSEAYISLASLMPPLPRSMLDTFPGIPTDASKPQPDCYWTVFNFFASKPDNRFYDSDFMETALAKVHEPVSGKPSYGDILFLVDSSGRPFHSAVYLADDFVFTKNGGHFTQPWVIMKLADMKACYPQARPVRETYYRWNPLKARPHST